MTKIIFVIFILLGLFACKAKTLINVDTKNQEGAFNKSVFIKSNAKNDVELIRIIDDIRKR